MNIEQLQSTKIQRAYLTPDQVVKAQLDSSLKKGLISEELHTKAVEQLDLLIKAGGEGSRGGHVIGHTKTGRPVYKGLDSASASAYKGFTSQDHEDASRFHAEESWKHHGAMMRTNRESHATYERAMNQHHVDAASSHAKKASELKKKEHEASMSPEDKKIFAKHQEKIEAEHSDMQTFHEQMAEHAKKMIKEKGFGHQAAKDEYHRHISAAEHHKRQASKESDLVQLTRG